MDRGDMLIVLNDRVPSNGRYYSGIVLDNECGRLKVLWRDSHVTVEWSYNLAPYYNVFKPETR